MTHYLCRVAVQRRAGRFVGAIEIHRRDGQQTRLDAKWFIDEESPAGLVAAVDDFKARMEYGLELNDEAYAVDWEADVEVWPLLNAAHPPSLH
jgi:hypothetical protein